MAFRKGERVTVEDPRDGRALFVSHIAAVNKTCVRLADAPEGLGFGVTWGLDGSHGSMSHTGRGFAPYRDQWYRLRSVRPGDESEAEAEALALRFGRMDRAAFRALPLATLRAIEEAIGGAS